MNPNHLAAYRAIEQAQKAMRAGDKNSARKFAVRAAQLAPDIEESWLMMAALSAPRASIAYIQKALEINPASERSRKAMAWAVKRLREKQLADGARPQKTTPVVPPPAPKKSPARPRFLFAALLLLVLCVVGFSAVWQGVTPARAFFDGLLFVPANDSPGWMQVDVAKPTYTLTPTATATLIPSATPTSTFTPSPTPTDTPTATPTNTPEPTAVPPTNPPEIPTALPTDVPPVETAIPTEEPPYVPPVIRPAGVGASEHWIDVDLTNQMLYAYEGDTLVASFIVSTGTWEHPTVLGQYRVYWKLRYKDMSGPGYYLPDVPFTMFFYQGYAIHGTYWHNNFGTPMSHGCVNMTIPDSEWVYNFSEVGTLVNVHY